MFQVQPTQTKPSQSHYTQKWKWGEYLCCLWSTRVISQSVVVIDVVIVIIVIHGRWCRVFGHHSLAEDFKHFEINGLRWLLMGCDSMESTCCSVWLWQAVMEMIRIELDLVSMGFHNYFSVQTKSTIRYSLPSQRHRMEWNLTTLAPPPSIPNGRTTTTFDL